MSKNDKLKIDYNPDISDLGHLIWVHNFTIASNNEFRAPFIVHDDNNYYGDLQTRYKKFFNIAKSAKADLESLKIINKYTSKVLEALRLNYKGRISSSQNVIENLVKGCLNNSFAVDTAYSSDAFPGVKSIEPQFFHARRGTPRSYKAREMLHLPYRLRSKTGNYRFSIPGVPSYYLGNSSYCCWLEIGMPPEHEFNVSPVLVDGTQKIFNLAVSVKDHHCLKEYNSTTVHTWIKLLILMIASSYRVAGEENEDRNFRSEYVIPQYIMLACKNQGLDGVAYFSNQVEYQDFAWSAINVALFAAEERFGNTYSDMCKHIKVGDAFNYFMFQQLGRTNRDSGFDLRWTRTGMINNIGNYDHQYGYAFTDFCEFDKFLFTNWKYDEIEYGNALMT